MRNKNYFWLLLLLALNMSFPAYSAVKSLLNTEFATAGAKVTTRTSTFAVTEPTSTEDPEEQTTTPVPLRAPAATEETPVLTDSQCKLTTTQQHYQYSKKIGDLYCTCPYFIDSLDDARAVCNKSKTYPSNITAPSSEPVPCYYQNEETEGECTTNSKTWGKTYFGCDCAGYYTAEEFCNKKLSNIYRGDNATKAIEECIATMDPNVDTGAGGGICHTRTDGNMENDSVPSPVTEYGDVEKYLNFFCKSGYNFKADVRNNYSDVSNDVYEHFYVGLGFPCIADAVREGKDEYSYKEFGLGCRESGTVVEKTNQCSINGENSLNYLPCYKKLETNNIYETTSSHYQCQCPEGYVQTCDHSEYKIGGGAICNFDADQYGNSITKYKSCKIRCGHDYAVAYSKNCSTLLIDGDAGKARQNSKGEDETCYVAEEISTDNIYICGCPSSWKTIDKWCEANYIEEGLKDVQECTTTYKGEGTPCYRDVSYDDKGEPIEVLTKYKSYNRSCPSDRPLYYSKEQCSDVGGVFDYTCHDGSINTRYVCKCPSGYYNEDGEVESGRDNCTIQSLKVVKERKAGSSVSETIYEDAERYISNSGEIGKWASTTYDYQSFSAEATGNYCSLNSENDLRYEACAVKCSALLNEFAKDGSYVYLSAEETSPTPLKCQNKLGSGAVLGYVGSGSEENDKQTYCSQNHELKYPCYCPKEFKTCSEEPNMVPASDAKSCTFNNVTYYSSCVPETCSAESENVALVPVSFTVDNIADTYGKSEQIMCLDNNGIAKFELSCDTSTYSTVCEYPYTAPRNSTDYCKYTDVAGDKMSSESAQKHYKPSVCRIRSELGVCGQSIIIGDSNTPINAAENGYTIQVAETENDCYTKFGAGVKAQLCEDANYNRAYNCFFKQSEYPYTTANCGVRHDLSGNYVLINGVKHWSTCKCVAAYQHHKFNCAGYLSGAPCEQTITQDLINGDSSLKDAEADYQDNSRTLVGSTLPYYPYCKCSSDFNKVCDEDGSGRYAGVGESCNGKYKECQCVPDPLPANWTDNYYGCPGGKRPTGVWKDNGCGFKYYQCSVTECTWEYTEACESPLEPVGEPCQDNTGKIGGYKSCRCPNGYKTCPEGQVGVGEPCNLKGVSYYKECKVKDSCAIGADKTCTGALQIGVNACTKDNVTYYEKCVCANGYNKICTNGTVGVGASCTIDGVTYYKECANPKENTCTSAHKEACTIYQEQYSPCVDTDSYGRQTVKYLCRCPSNWKVCASDEMSEGASCKDSSGTIYSEKCYSSHIEDGDDTSATCNEYQNANYKVCTSAQSGYGGNCIYTDDNNNSVRKYAKCEDSNDCAINGFKYACSGYEESAQGDYCIDANGNKLYKSCACPTSYVDCPNESSTKGTKCSPLKADGTLGDAVYSSCTCEKGRFKYTCAAEATGNVGIIPPTSPDAKSCEESSGTDSVVRYTYCSCKEEYQYNCLNADAGYVNPKNTQSSDATDYCELNNVRFYKGCDCRSDYKYATDDDCEGNNQEIDRSSSYCIPVGNFASAEDNGHTSGIKYYKECKDKSTSTETTESESGGDS